MKKENIPIYNSTEVQEKRKREKRNRGSNSFIQLNKCTSTAKKNGLNCVRVACSFFDYSDEKKKLKFIVSGIVLKKKTKTL